MGCLVCVQQLDHVGMIQSLEEADLLHRLLSTQQLLVDVFRRNRALAPPLVTPLGHREATPEGLRANTDQYLIS